MQKFEIHEAGTAVLTATNTTKAVTFTKPFTSGVTPIILLTPPFASSFWLTNISNTGFTANFGSTSVYDQTFDYIAVRSFSVT